MPPRLRPEQPPHLRPRVQITLPTERGWLRTTPSSPSTPRRPKRITSALRAAGTGGTVAGLDGFTTFVPPPDGPLQPDATRPPAAAGSLRDG